MKLFSKHSGHLLHGILAISWILLQSNTFAQTNASPSVTQTNAPPSAVQATNTYFQPFTLDMSVYDSPYRLSLFKPLAGEDGARTWSQTKSMFFYALGAIGVLVMLPEESTGWDGSANDLLNKWLENVKAGPEWDRNKWAYNYIGHAYFGGVYYQIARKSGYRQWDSFLYTALMSTFLWEYGLEAFAEVPSIQDLIFTPIAGWLYGEWAYQTEYKIRSNNNEVLGSGILGGVSLFFLDPVDACGSAVNWIARRQLIKSGYGYFSYNPVEIDGKTDHQVYLNMIIPIGASGPSETEQPKYKIHYDDPVDFGIIGFGTSLGHTALDKHWGLTDDIYTKLNLGLYFNPKLSMRLAYAWGDLSDRETGEIVEYENYSWDTQYYFFSDHKLRPYLTGGFGRQLREEDNDTRTFQWNGGLGLHWQMHKKLSLNTDWIGFYSPSRKTFDQQFNAGLIYRFGGGEHNDW